MTGRCKTAWPMRAGRVMAGLATAWLLAGCGGGGGGGGGSSPTPQPTVLATANVVAGSTTSTSTTPTSGASASTPTLTVAAGANGATPVTITVSTDPSAPSVPNTDTADSSVYTIAVSPAGQAFTNSGLTVSFPYTTPTGNTTVDPRIYYYDTTTGVWTPLPSTANIANNSATLSTAQLPTGTAAYAVLSSNLPGTPGSPL